MGTGAGIVDAGADTDVTTIGSITMTAAGYIPLGYAVRGTNVIQIGAGGTGATGGSVANSAPTVIVNGPIQGPGGAAGQSDVLFSSSFTSGGRGTVILNAQSNYVGITAMNQNSARVVGDIMPLVQLGINNALPATTDLVWGEANGNGGALRYARLQPDGQLDQHQEQGSWSQLCRRHHQLRGGMSTLTINDSGSTPRGSTRLSAS